MLSMSSYCMPGFVPGSGDMVNRTSACTLMMLTPGGRDRKQADTDMRGAHEKGQLVQWVMARTVVWRRI